MLVFLMLLVQACREEEHPIPAMSGFLLTLEEDAATVETRSAPSELYVPVAKNFTVRIVKSSTGSVAYDRAYTNQPIPLSAGDYTLTASYGTDVAIGLDAPYYEGSTSATVEKDQVTPVTIRCGVANALISVKYVDADTKQESLERFDRFFSSYDVRVQVGNNSLLLPHDTEQSVYFPAGSIPSLQFKGTLKDHADRAVSYSFPTEQIPTFEAGTHAIFYLSVAPLEEGVGLYIEKVEVKQERISETVPMEWLPKPKITGFANGATSLEYVETNDAIAANIGYTTSLPMQDMEFTIDIAGDSQSQYATIDGHTFTLSALTEEERTALNNAGIILPTIDGVSTTGNIDLTALTANLQTTAGADAVSTIKVRVKANNRWSTEQGAETVYSIKTVKPEFTIDALEGNMWSKEFTIEEITVNKGNTDILKKAVRYQYSTDNGATWTLCSDTRTHKFSTHPSQKEYIVRAFLRNGIVSNTKRVTLETPTQMPNSDLNSWHYTEKKSNNDGNEGSIFNSKYTYIPTFYPWASNGSSFWNTNNAYTTRYNDRSFGRAYNCFPAVSYIYESANDFAAEIRNTASGSGNTSAGSGSIVYDKNKKAGILFTGSFECDETSTINAATSFDYTITPGREWDVRPTELQFQYKYNTLSGTTDTFLVEFQLWNDSQGNEVIAEGSLESSQVTSNYTTASVVLNYNENYLMTKCKYIYVCFHSTKTEGENMVYARGKDCVLYKGSSAITYKDVSMGSVLTIDDISLVYDK